MPEHRHEVVVAVPARDDVTVQVRDASARDSRTQIEAHVETIGLECDREQLLPTDDLIEQIASFRRVELREVGHVTIRHGEQMARIVREAVLDQVAQR